MAEPKSDHTPATKTKVNQTNFLKNKPRFNALVLSFLVVAFSIGGYFVYSSFASEGPTEFNDKAEVESQVKALTSSVKLRSAKYANSRRNHSSDETKNKDTVAHVTAQRRLAMRKLMLKKPELASKYVLPDEAKNDLPDEAKGQVESRINVEGTWVISEDERFDAKTGRIVSSKNIYSIQTDKTSYNLTNTSAPKGIQHASTVKVEGVTIDGMMAANKDGIVDKVTAQAIN